MENWKYTAFISYRHGGVDEYVAKTLHTMLESYRVPSRLVSKTGKKKVGRIFRDVDELPSSSSLYNNIEEALSESEFLIVICTPRLKESKWCMREIELFKQMRGSDSIIAVLAQGEPQDSFPYEITHRLVNGEEIEVEPLAADVRGTTQTEQKKKIKLEKLRILAAMLHCEFDQLRQRDRQKKMQRAMVAGGVGLAVICTFLGQTMYENIKLQKQVRKTQSAQSYLLAEYSDNALSADNPKLAAQLAMEAIPENLGNSRPFEGAAMSALTNALQIYDYQKGYTAKCSVQTQTMDAVLVSPYDDYIAYIDLTSDTDYTLHFYDIEKEKTVADFPVDPDYNGYGGCNSKIAFFGDHLCAIPGKKGIQVIDMKTLKVLWEGAKAMTVSASKDNSVVSAYNIDEEKLTFYTSDGEKLSERKWDCVDSIYLGMSDNGKYAALTELTEDEVVKALYIVDTHTGKIVKNLNDLEYTNILSAGGSWCGNKLLFKDDKDNYGYIDLDGDGKSHMTKTKVEAAICYTDKTKGLAYYIDGSDLTCISITSGKTLKTYEGTKKFSDVVYTGDSKSDTFVIYCDDGSLEYIDFTEDPFRIGRLEGDGTSCSELSVGKTYIAACLYNNYEFRIYQLNNKNSDKKGSLKKSPSERIVTMIRYGEQLCLNGNINSYSINMNTLKGVKFNKLPSYMQVVNEDIVSCDNLDGTISFYDSHTGKLLCNLPDGVYDNQEANGAYLVEDGVLKKYDYSETDEKEAKPVYTEEVPKECKTAFIAQNNYLVGIKKNGDNLADTLFIMDPNRKEVFSQKISDFKSSSERDYVLYQPEGSKEYILYNYVEGKELTRLDLGELSWSDYIDGGYLFLCSSDTGAYILNENTGEVILKISDANTLYNFAAPKNQPYFTALYLSDNGETRLDVYKKDELSSPIAKIKGGLGMNSKGEVLIYDGLETVYLVPFLTVEQIYESGKKFLGNETLTLEQKKQYHCE